MNLPSIDTTNQQTAILPVVPRKWDMRMARWISNAGNPAILATSGLLVTAGSLEMAGAWVTAAVLFIANIVVPMGYILLLLRRGKVSDFDVYLREQRWRPYIFTIGCASITLVAMRIYGAPLLFQALTGASLLQTSLMAVINRYWKISAHAAGAACFSVLVVFIGGRHAIPFTALLPLIIWSRLHLHRHTFWQTIAGASLGAAIFIGALIIFF